MTADHKILGQGKEKEKNPSFIFACLKRRKLQFWAELKFCLHTKNVFHFSYKPVITVAILKYTEHFRWLFCKIPAIHRT